MTSRWIGARVRGPLELPGLMWAAATGSATLLLIACTPIDDPADAGNDTRPRPSPASSAAPTPSTTPPSVAGSTLTITDHGRTVRLPTGETATLALANPVTRDPDVTGHSIQLYTIDNIAPSPTQRFTIRALRTGTATITATDGHGRVFTLTVHVSAN